ncbi:coiled-coil domain-containing protein 130-like [Tachyglossus aculeatus]|uniref:coiled-coil domain-containing protein 130-like n=1 Tax=Tachyglossus aculeatus TaxID=9261 RepID=UPI0018F2B72F|nr:coiled-coil domain-containing protein 130-like [Tachyglossus aculeatus]
MGERKGVNKYYPPDFDPSKHGSLNWYQNSHPLRERARKLSQGVLIIPFEMPYNIWCDGCKNHIGMGVRYNAEKKKAGNYYTTPIYRFRMKCHLCINYIKMQSDPTNCDYVIVSGAQRKEECWDMEDNEQILTTEGEEKKKLETDAMFRLEHGTADRGKLHKAVPTLSNIQEAQSAWKDDFALNSMLRRKFREEKKVIKEDEEKDLALQTKASLSIPLVREPEEDRKLAALFKYHSLDSYEAKQKLKRTEISGRPWFSPTSTPGSDSKANDVLKKLAIGRKPSTSNLSLGVSNLGIILQKSKEECENPAGDFLSSRVLEALGASEGEESSWEVVQNSFCGPTNPECPQETESKTAPSTTSISSSLVADYSDTESD